MTMEDLHDHAGAIKHLRTGCTLEVACLARRDLVIDDHELRLRRHLRIWLDLRASGFFSRRPQSVRGPSTSAGLPSIRRRPSAGDRREFLKPPLPSTVPPPIRRASATSCRRSRNRASSPDGQLLDARGVRDVVDARTWMPTRIARGTGGLVSMIEEVARIVQERGGIRKTRPASHGRIRCSAGTESRGCKLCGAWCALGHQGRLPAPRIRLTRDRPPLDDVDRIDFLFPRAFARLGRTTGSPCAAAIISAISSPRAASPRASP